MPDLYETALQAAKVLAERLAIMHPETKRWDMMARIQHDLRQLPQITADVCAEDLHAFQELQRTLADASAWLIDGRPLRWSQDFDDYERDLKAARRKAKEAYVHYRSMYDALNELPTKVADASQLHLDNMQSYSGELEDLFAADFWL